MGNAPDTSEYVLATSDTLLANAKVLAVAAGLQLNVTTSQIQVQPVSYLGSLQSLNTTGILCATANGVITPRVLTSLGTINITNPGGVADEMVLDVVDATTIQKVQIAFNNAPSSPVTNIIGEEAILNFIPGSNMGISIVDNRDTIPPRIDLTFSSSSQGGGGGDTNATYWTQANEISNLPNSKILKNGAGIGFPHDNTTNITSVEFLGSAGTGISIENEINGDNTYAKITSLLTAGNNIQITEGQNNDWVIAATGSGGGGAPTTATYITSLDETTDLPNSFQVSFNPETGQDYNTRLGINSLPLTYTGHSSVAFGSFALSSLTTGLCGGFGAGALQYCTSGNLNFAFGSFALQSTTTGSHNTAVGYSAGSGNVTGSSNVFLGSDTGIGSTVYNQSIIVGDLTDSTTSSITNSIAMGFQTRVNTDNTCVFGNQTTQATVLGGYSSVGNFGLQLKAESGFALNPWIYFEQKSQTLSKPSTEGSGVIGVVQDTTTPINSPKLYFTGTTYSSGIQVPSFRDGTIVTAISVQNINTEYPTLGNLVLNSGTAPILSKSIIISTSPSTGEKFLVSKIFLTPLVSRLPTGGYSPVPGANENFYPDASDAGSVNQQSIVIKSTNSSSAVQLQWFIINS